MYRSCAAAVVALVFAACATNDPPKPAPARGEAAQGATQEPEVALRVVKWPELEKAIAAHKGKVVVLDVWAEY